MNRSVNGDIVVVEVFPESQWKAPGEEVVDQDGRLLEQRMAVKIVTDSREL